MRHDWLPVLAGPLHPPAPRVGGGQLQGSYQATGVSSRGAPTLDVREIIPEGTERDASAIRLNVQARYSASEIFSYLHAQGEVVLMLGGLL